MPAENLPVPVSRGEDRVSALAAAFAASAKSRHTQTARVRDLLGPSGPARGGSRPARTPAWIPWCAGRHIDPLGQVRAAYLLAWLADLAAGGDSESTRNRRLATVSAWYDYLIRDEQVPRNPVGLLKPGEKPKSAKTIHRTSPTHAPSRDQAGRLQRAADEHSPLASAFVALLVGTGARVSELANINVGDFYQDGGHVMLAATGKGGIVNQVPVPPDVWSRVWRLLQDRADDDDRLPVSAGDTGGGGERPLLSRQRTKKRMGRQELAKLLAALLRKAGIDGGRYTPHSFRNAYISDGVRDGVPIRDLQRAVGHRSVETTIRYDKSHLSPERHPNYRRAAQLAEARDRFGGSDEGKDHDE
jgi:integrase/recombinase XerD